MQRTRPGPTAEHNDGDNCDWESKHGQDTDNGDWKDLSWDVVIPMMAIGMGFLAIVPIDGDRESLVFKFAIDPFLNLVRKLIGRGRCCRNRNGCRGRCRDQRKMFSGTVDETRQSRRLAQRPLQWSFRASVNESRWESFKVTQRDPSTDARDDDDFSRRVPTACQPRQSDSRGR